MKKFFILTLLVVLISTVIFAGSKKGLKVFISVDMEGITGVVVSAECRQGGRDYQYFRKIMTEETNAAIEGALEAGATEIWVRDSHGSALNIIPHLLHKKAKLLRNWSGGLLGMMEGIDKTFDAVMFIGYHAKAGTPNAIVDHTSSGSVTDMAINGISLPEAGYNALTAGHFNVPVVFVAGDQAICNQVTKLFGSIETVAVKKGIGEASLSIHPSVARQKIHQGTARALKNLKGFKPYKMKPPYTLVLKLKSEAMINRGSSYPGAIRTGTWELTYKSSSILEVIKAFSRMRN